MLQQIAYYPILGHPLILYLGIATYTSLLTTAAIQTPAIRRKTRLHPKWHHRLAALTITLATAHATLALLTYL